MPDFNFDKDLEKKIKKIKELTGEREKETKSIKQTEAATENLNKDRRTEHELLKALVKGQAQMVQTLRSIHTATNKTSRSTRNLNRQNLLWIKNTRILGGSLAVLRSKLLVFTFGIGLLERSIGKLLSAYGDFEASQKRIERVIKSTGGAAGVTSEEIFAMNASFEEQTGIAETVINQASALLLTFTKIGQEVFPDVTQAVLDMTVVMYQGNVTLEALKTTSIQVGKALQDPTKGLTALRRVGVSFNSAQKEWIESLQNSNQLAKAQGIILDELKREFGDQAALNTYNQAVLRLDTSIGNLAKRMGEELRPAVEPLITGLTELIDSLDASEIIDFTKALMGTVIALGFIKKGLTLGLLAQGRNIKSLSKLRKVLKLTAFNFIGLTSSMRKASIATRAMAVSLKALSGATGIGLLISVLLPSFIGLFKDAGDKTNDFATSSEDAQKALDKLNEVTKDNVVTSTEFRNIEKEFPGIFKETHSVWKLREEIVNDTVKALNAIIRKQEELQLSDKGLSGSTTNVADKVDEATKSFRDKLFILENSVDINGKINKSDQTMIKTIVDLKGHIADENGNLLSLAEAYANLDPELKKAILSYNDEVEAIERTKAQKLADIDITKAQQAAYIEFFNSLSDGITNYLEMDLSRWKEGEIGRLETQKDVINDTVRNERRKASELAAVDKKIEAIEKKAHNRGLLIKGLDMTMDLATSISKIMMAASTAKMMALLLPPGVDVIKISTIEAMKNIQIASASAGWAIGMAGLMAQKAALGADFTTTGPQMLMVGDNPGGRERVQVTPLSSPNVAGPQGGASVVVNVSGNVMSKDFVEGELAENIKEAIRRGTDFGIS
jgi:hypothetical protein